MTADLKPSIRIIDEKAKANAVELERARNGLKHAQNEVDRFQTTISILEGIEAGYSAAAVALTALLPAETSKKVA